MAHDVFISHVAEDKPVAEAVCATLESQRIRCWMAPRDVLPTANYAEALIDAIDQSRLVVLVLSSNSNESFHVIREVGAAVRRGIPVLPFRVENVPLSPGMEFLTGGIRGVNALTPPLEKHLQQLAETVRLIMSGQPPAPGPPAEAPAAEPPLGPTTPPDAYKAPLRRRPIGPSIEAMSHIFISHVEEDADVGLRIALGLEEEGFRTWCYEVDSIPGVSYLVQTGQAIQGSSAVVLVVSAESLGSRQVTSEVVRAHESGKPFIPVRRGITHIEFQGRQPEWREALGATTSIGIPAEGPGRIIPRILDGLRALGIHPGGGGDVARVAEVRRTLAELNLPEKAGLAPGGTLEGTGVVAPVVDKGPGTPTPVRNAPEGGIAVRWGGHPIVRLGAVFLAVAGVVALIFLLVGWPFGAGDGGSTPTAGAPELGTYTGITSQGRSVEFDVIEGSRAIGRLEFDVEGECPLPTPGVGPQPTGCTCNVNRETRMTKPWPIGDTGFSYAPGDFEFSAVFNSTTTATGFVRVHTSGTGGQAPCSSAQVTWTASLQ
jgi:hypothetical protein